MTYIRNNVITVGDKVVILHKKRPSTTATLQIGVVVWVSPKIATVAVEGLNSTKHTNKTIIKI